jgi:hypothetical protein
MPDRFQHLRPSERDVSPKRGDRVAPPPAAGEWELRFATNEAAKGWESLTTQAPGPVRKAWEVLAQNPCPHPETARQHRLKGLLASASQGGLDLPPWQYEVTGAGRIWYVVEDDRRVVYLRLASTGHPKATD